MYFVFFFFFQAEDGIRDWSVTGVQTCALPIYEIFRIAHSLKGMSATMGFASVAALTHEMENVFELLRERRGGLEREAITVLLECLDALSGAVEAIDTQGVEKIDEEPLIERLQGLIRNEDH